MSRRFVLFLIATLCVDQVIKSLFLQGFRWDSSCLSLTLVFNRGVAFSLLSFLGEGLKYLQPLFIAFIGWFAYKEKMIVLHPVASGLLLGAGLSNLLDRFVWGGVVDYVAWHCGFEFAIFNFADVMIDLAIVIFLYQSFFNKKLS